jgi:hypothetical protein
LKIQTLFCFKSHHLPLVCWKNIKYFRWNRKLKTWWENTTWTVQVSVL